VFNRQHFKVSPVQNDTDLQTEVRTHCPGPITFISLQSTTKVEKIFRASPAGGELSFLVGIPSPRRCLDETLYQPVWSLSVLRTESPAQSRQFVTVDFSAACTR